MSLFDDQSGEGSDEEGSDEKKESEEKEELSNLKSYITAQKERKKRIKEWEKESVLPEWRNIPKSQTKVIICPICKEFGDFKTSPMDVLNHGFTMEPGFEDSLYAPHGICVGRCIEENESTGTELIIRGSQQLKEEDIEDRTKCPECEYPGPWDEKHSRHTAWYSDGDTEKGTTTGFGGWIACLECGYESDKQQRQDPGLSRERRDEMKSTYASSMGSVDILILQPPYSGFKDALSTIKWSEKDPTEEKEQWDRTSDKTSPRDWFDNLKPDFVELEQICNKSNAQTLTIRERLFIVSFLHKSVTFRHIETIWMYSKRFQISIRGIEALFNGWPSEQPAFAAKYLQKLSEVKPTRISIESLLSNAKRMGTFELTRGDEEYLIEQACQLLTKIEKLKSTSGTSMMENCIKAAIHNEKTSLSGESWPVVGLIEALILKSVVEKAYKGQKIKKDLAISISETLFPLPMNGVPLWKWMLSNSAIQLVKKWDILTN